MCLQNSPSRATAPPVKTLEQGDRSLAVLGRSSRRRGQQVPGWLLTRLGSLEESRLASLPLSLFLETNPSSVPSEPRRALCRGFILPTHLHGFARLGSLGAVLVGAVTSFTFSRPGPLGKGHLRRQMGLLQMEEIQPSNSSFASATYPPPAPRTPCHK